MVRRALLVVLVSAFAAAAPAAAEPELTGYPGSIASTGDSITRAFNTCWLPFTDCTPNSWSTGGSVESHYRRILAANPAAAGRSWNHAVSGADMADLQAQVQGVVARRAAYVTILMGANDVCARSESGMTAVDTFRAQFGTAMATLSAGLPDARIYVVSIPDVYRLWELYRYDFLANSTWTLGRVCQSMLANAFSNSTADVARRARVRQRNVDYNTQLAEVCALYVHCRFDGNAVFGTDFVRSDVSQRDYFHPSVAGQRKLASISWAATFDFTDAVAPVSAAAPTPADGGTSVTLSATDAAGVRGIEYRLGESGWARYDAPLLVPTGQTLTWRAVDVNGNVEATQTLVG